MVESTNAIIICHNQEYFEIDRKIIKHFTILDHKQTTPFDFSNLEFFTKDAISCMLELFEQLLYLKKITFLEKQWDKLEEDIYDKFIRNNYNNPNNYKILLIVNLFKLGNVEKG